MCVSLTVIIKRDNKFRKTRIDYIYIVVKADRKIVALNFDLISHLNIVQKIIIKNLYIEFANFKSKY